MTNVLQPVSAILTLVNADTEYSWTVPANTALFTIQPRTDVAIRYATETGKVATPTDPYGTLKAGQVWNSPERGLLPPGTVLYFAADDAGTVLEILYFLQIN